MPEGMSAERLQLLKIFGAEVMLTDADKGMQGAIDLAGEIVKKQARGFMPQQFLNPDNPAAHRDTTAREIWDDTDGAVDIFVAGVGTGGTPCRRSLVSEKEETLCQNRCGGARGMRRALGRRPGHHKLQGLGAGFVPEILDMKMIDEIIKVGSSDAGRMTRLLASRKAFWPGYRAARPYGRALKSPKGKKRRGKRSSFSYPIRGSDIFPPGYSGIAWNERD